MSVKYDEMESIMKRDKYIDYLRGSAIILVVFAHALQSCTNMVVQDKLQANILLFEMPLMFMISGWTYSFALPIKFPIQAIITKVKRILIPYVCWSIIIFFYNAVISKESVSFGGFIDFLFTSEFWFLRALFVVFVICNIGACLYKKIVTIMGKKMSMIIGIVTALIFMVLVSFLPGLKTTLLGGYFVVGILVGELYNKCPKRLWWVSIIAFLIYPLSIIYSEKISGITLFVVDKIIGIIGSLAFVLVIKLLSDRFEKLFNYIGQIGENTLPIYAIHWGLFFVPNIIKWGGIAYIHKSAIYCRIMAIAVSVFWLVLSLCITKLISYSNVLSICLLGKEKRK